MQGIMHFPGAISFQIDCEDQEEIDDLWEKLAEGGNPDRQRCGWVKGRFGVSWQAVPRCLNGMLATSSGENLGGGERVVSVVRAMMGVKKMDIGGLRRAFEGGVKESE